MLSCDQISGNDSDSVVCSKFHRGTKLFGKCIEIFASRMTKGFSSNGCNFKSISIPLAAAQWVTEEESVNVRPPVALIGTKVGGVEYNAVAEELVQVNDPHVNSVFISPRTNRHQKSEWYIFLVEEPHGEWKCEEILWINGDHSNCFA